VVERERVVAGFALNGELADGRDDERLEVLDPHSLLPADIGLFLDVLRPDVEHRLLLETLA
jgi:hypothetical protein